MNKNYLRISTAIIAGATISCTGNMSKGQQPEKPNVLFIMVDDLNDWVGLLDGHPQAITPNIDRFFGNGGMIMRNAHCPATVCGPSRSAMLTGRMPATTGLYVNTDNMRNSDIASAFPTMPEYFSQHGYFSLSTGKIFHKHRMPGGETDSGEWAFDLLKKEHGSFDIDMDKFPLNGLPSIPGRENIGVRLDWGPTIVEKEETLDWISAQWAADQLLKDHEKPFFMMLGMSKPHLTWYVPQEYFDLYDLNTIQIPNLNENDLQDILTPDGKQKFEPSGDYEIIKAHNKFAEATRAYLACISYVDACLGQVFDALENSKYKDNTIVVLAGDHGWFLGEKLRFRKTHLWEESTRVPLLIKHPAGKSNADCSRPVNLVDLYPTLADLCKLPEPEFCDGKSFAPLLNDPKKSWHPTLTTMEFENHSIRSDRYRYTRWADGTEELYDHQTDQNEWNNLINDPGYREIIQEHKAYLPAVNQPPSAR